MMTIDHNPKRPDRVNLTKGGPFPSLQKRSLFFAPLLLLTFLACGCALHKVALPEVIQGDPTRDEIIAAVNGNSGKIDSLVSSDGTLGVSSSPWTARCRLAFQRETKVRLTGNLNMVGPVIDFGSDGELFWFWFKNQEPNQISYCRLDEYAKSAFKDQIPVDPIWLPEALGVVTIEPSEIIEGPVMERDNTLKLVVKKSRPEGDYLKYVYLEPKTAAIKRQDIKNPVTNEILTVSCDEFQYDKEKGVVLPKKITISRSMAKERIYIDLGTLQVNPVDQSFAQAFKMPKPEELGSTLVNIGPNGTVVPPSVAPEIPPQANAESATITANQTGASGDIPSFDAAVANSGASNSEIASANRWGTGNSSYSNNRSIYASENAAGKEIPTGTTGDAAVASSADSSATVQFQTIVPPDENRFMDRNQGFYRPSL